MPVFLTILVIVLEVGNLWMARVQLKNALEAGALAAVKSWGEAGGGDTMTARTVGNEFASAVVVNGSPVNLASIDATLNYNAANPGNQNNACTGVFIFGTLTSDNPRFVFEACETSGCGAGIGFAVRAQATYTVPSISNQIFGVSVGSYTVSAKADAIYDCTDSRPAIYHIEDTDFMCSTTCP